ncbi:MAG TPA: hypothetical protein VMU85_05515 [Stellaceae bacterium]|nr:hypothetical protein [Stellaceae bacterium]
MAVQGMTPMQSVAARWETAKPMVIALAIGLVAGPVISSYMGWQVTAGTARTETRDSVVDQLAQICATRARAEVADPSKLDWEARSALAKKWVVEPGLPFKGLEVTGACAQKLAV